MPKYYVIIFSEVERFIYQYFVLIFAQYFLLRSNQ